MPNVQDYLLTVDNDKETAARIASDTSTGKPSSISITIARVEIQANVDSPDLQTRTTSLTEVVQSLREYINDENSSIRTKASSYLTAVINALPPKFMSRQQIQVLCQFFCDRVEDGGGMAGFEGLKACVLLDRFGGEMATMTGRA